MNCRLCRSADVEVLVDYGPQPICNRFLASPDAPEATFPLGMAQCRSCGLIQLITAPPAAELLPPFDWITYKEAEGHLDRVADTILRVTGLAPDTMAVGVSYKDSSLVDRLEKRGHRRPAKLDPAADLGITSPCAGIETLQGRLTPARAREIARRHGKAGLVIARHILEHAHDLHDFMAAIRELLAPAGFIVIEVPDFSIALENFDYSTIWEEHTAYFTPDTFLASFPHFGFRVLDFANYPYPLENSLVAIAQLDPNASEAGAGAADSLRKGRAYREHFEPTRRDLNAHLAAFNRAAGPVAVFGAGHLACKYVNLLGIREHIRFVADDHPRKKGLYMPGSRLPIVASTSLIDQGIRLCLLSLNPESEEKVLQNNGKFVQSGGVFASIFPASPRALRFRPNP